MTENFSKLIELIINWPLWFFMWGFISSWILFYFPDIAPPTIQPYVLFLAIIFTVGILCKIGSILYTQYCKKPEPKKTFHLTEDYRVQPFITKLHNDNLQMGVDFFVENLTNNKLCIAAARVIKPRKIKKTASKLF